MERMRGLIKAVLFDFDGTLIDTNKLILETFKYTLKKHLNICPDDSELVQYFGEPLATTLKRYDEKNYEALLETYHGYNKLMHDKLVEKIDGAEETLRALKDMGMRVGVVTSKRKVVLELGMKLVGLNNIMDVIITPEDTKKHKPDGEPIEKACEKLGISTSEVIYVGDSHYDIQCGKNAGSSTCLVKYTALPLEKLYTYNPEYAVDNLIELLDIVKEENSRAV